jgi:nucleotide-binding universal stress UspA family protein
MPHAISVQESEPKAADNRSPPESAPVSLRRVLVALDASDHANRALLEAVRLAASADGVVTGIHAYAARLHDRRFRQMEGGLPERYRHEDEMERQREVHDDLITRGLDIISNSYHDAAEKVCDEAGRPYRRLSPEGKNYRRIVEATASGEFDVLALGALGLGAVSGSLIGTVCERTVRRSPIDVLVIREPERALGDGPLVAAVDGSPRSFGALRTALDLGRRLAAPVHVVAAYDPYYHYVAFNKIAGVLSEEAGKVFRFKEQQKLHEELIDDGLAKIYQSHLALARGIAEDEGGEIVCELLDGKPYQAIGRYLVKVGASLLVLGKTGIHADAELDIGGNAENLLRLAPCHVWLGQATFTPPLDAVARETITWTEEAERKLARVPEVAHDMVRMAILRLAQERGHTVVTCELIDEATRMFCPARGGGPEPETEIAWSDEAAALLDAVGDASVAASVRLRAEKRARRDGAGTVGAGHVRQFLDDGSGSLPWTAAALARLARAPEPTRERARARIDALARERRAAEVTSELVEAALEKAPAAVGGDKEGACPFADTHGAENSGLEVRPSEPPPLQWTPEAEERMHRVPRGFIRALTRQRIEVFARRHHARTITPALVDEKYAEWEAGSAKQRMNLEWEEKALARIERIPEFVRGMVVLEIERCAREMGKDTVTEEVIGRARSVWAGSGAFHSEAYSDLYRQPRRGKRR